MPRERTGSVEPHGDHFDARIRLPNGKRSPRMCLDPAFTHEEAKLEARELQRVADEEHARARALSAANGVSYSDSVYSNGGRTATKSNAAIPGNEGETLDSWIERWFVDRQARRIEDVDNDRSRYRNWIADELGNKPIASITTSDLEAFVEILEGAVQDERISWKNSRQRVVSGPQRIR